MQSIRARLTLRALIEELLMYDHEATDAFGRFAISTWESEGGAVQFDAMDDSYGRRVEIDRSSTVYHFFTGRPAHERGITMTGLTRGDATEAMLSMNRRNVLRRQKRNSAQMDCFRSARRA
jgi:hypothetical protein